MPLLFEKGDITKLHVDAIVNAANETLLGGGGVDGCIHRAAGPELLAECRTLNGCKTGDAKITKGYKLSAKHVIHTVGPIWHGGNYGEKEALVSCYKRSLEIAVENNCKTVAFPLISAGAYGYPKDDARDVAIETIRDFLAEQGSYMTVYLVFYNGPAYDYSNRKDYLFRKELEALLFRKTDYEDEKLCCDSCICENRVYFDEICDEKKIICKKELEKPLKSKKKPGLLEKLTDKLSKSKSESAPEEKSKRPVKPKTASAAGTPMLGSVCASMTFESMGDRISDDDSIDDDLRRFIEAGIGRGKSFAEKLMEYIDKRGITNAECYRYANVSKQIFSNILSIENYIPKKHVALGFAIALKLNIDETEDLLKSAGYALSDNYTLDRVVMFFIGRRVYDIFKINDILNEFNEKQLGAGY